MFKKLFLFLLFLLFVNLVYCQTISDEDFCWTCNEAIETLLIVLLVGGCLFLASKALIKKKDFQQIGYILGIIGYLFLLGGGYLLVVIIVESFRKPIHYFNKQIFKIFDFLQLIICKIFTIRFLAGVIVIYVLVIMAQSFWEKRKK